MKKFSSILVVLLLMMASFTAGLEYPRGDVDQNGEVNIGDAVTLIDYLLNGYWPDEAPTPTTGQTFTVNGVSFTMIPVEGGTFMMGATQEQINYSNDCMDISKPVHEVTLSDYSIGQTEVTQALWQAVMGSNPSHFMGDPLRPVDFVTWKDCQRFITKLNELTGQNFRLPTEAEWEFAARGGNYSMGYVFSGSNELNDVAWHYRNSGTYITHSVGLRRPNEIGLYDMSGNVCEWCQDYYGSYTSEAQTNPTGPETPDSSYSYDSRVIRGGSYDGGIYNHGDCRVSRRYNLFEQSTLECIGLRLAM